MSIKGREEGTGRAGEIGPNMSAEWLRKVSIFSTSAERAGKSPDKKFAEYFMVDRA